MTTYTIYQPNRNPEAQIGMSAEDAARELLCYDGAEFKISDEVFDIGFTLWCRKPNAGAQCVGEN